MNETEHLNATLHARTGRFKRKVAESLRIVEDALSTMNAPYIALSGGKDSTCVLHLVRLCSPDVPGVWSDDEWNLPETIDYIDQVDNVHRIAARVEHSEWFTSWDTKYPELPEGTAWLDTPNNDGLQAFARRQQYDGVFIGLRAKENSLRHIHLRKFGTLYFAQKHGVWQCNPIAWWSVQDVWAYIVSNDVPYNAAYDRLSEIGVALEYQRIGPLSQARALGYGQLQILKRGWPELFNQFANKYPEARSYV